MTARGKEAAALALHRFGFGPAAGQIDAIAADPRGALIADLDRSSGMPSVDLPSSGTAERAVFDFRAEEQARQKLEQRAKKAADASTMEVSQAVMDAPSGASAVPQKPPENKPPPLPQQILFNEAKVRFDAACAPTTGLVERLVWFWSNHFCISADKIPSMAGAYEREAVRPYVLGRFADLLLAVESHPAMLFYLDNVESMGPNSIAGINRDRGLNENLARETLELHTLGVRSGYTQTDVTNFAKVLTGWTWIGPGEPDRGGEFAFNKRLHEPGDQIVMGKRYPDTGVEQGRAILSDLARHPATAQHIARKLAAHFVADEPPPTLVARLAKNFADTNGDLKELARTLIAADESWVPRRQKLKTPAQWITAGLRLTGAYDTIPIGRIMVAQTALGEPLWRPPAPNGFADTEAAWIDGVPRRLDIANEFAARVPAADPAALIELSLGPLASAETRATISRAESRRQALAFLVMAPEFLRS